MMGEGAWLAFPPGDIVGPQHIELGKNVFIGARVLLSACMPTETLPAERDVVISIGDRTTIGQGSMLNGRIGIHLDHDVTLAPNEFRQLGSILSSLNAGNTYNARIIVRVTSGSGRVTAYGSVVDNLTSDPTYVPAQK